MRTLTPKELSEGLAEVIKYAVIGDNELFAYLEENLDLIKSLDQRLLEEIVFRSAKIKAEVVAKDEKDLGLRHILNYGHTLGHAIESASDFKLEHGKAIALGMLGAGRISNKLGQLDKNELIRLKNIIQRAELTTELPDLELEKLIQAMKHDKKILRGKIRFILPKTLGSVFVTEEVSLSLVEKTLVSQDGKT